MPWKRARAGPRASSLPERRDLAMCGCQEPVRRHKSVLSRLFALWGLFSHRNKAQVELGSLPGSKALLLSSQLQPQTFTPPHCLGLAGALMGASETTDPQAPLPRLWGCGNWGPQRTQFKLPTPSFWGC